MIYLSWIQHWLELVDKHWKTWNETEGAGPYTVLLTRYLKRRSFLSCLRSKQKPNNNNNNNMMNKYQKTICKEWYYWNHVSSLKVPWGKDTQSLQFYTLRLRPRPKIWSFKIGLQLKVRPQMQIGTWRPHFSCKIPPARLCRISWSQNLTIFSRKTNRLPGRFQGHNESSPPRHPCPALGCSRVCKKNRSWKVCWIFDGKNTHPLLFLLALGAMFLTQWSVTHHMLLFVASEPLLITSLFTSPCSILFYGHPGMSKIGCFKMSKALVWGSHGSNFWMPTVEGSVIPPRFPQHGFNVLESPAVSLSASFCSFPSASERKQP